MDLNNDYVKDIINKHKPYNLLLQHRKWYYPVLLHYVSVSHRMITPNYSHHFPRVVCSNHNSMTLVRPTKYLKYDNNFNKKKIQKTTAYTSLSISDQKEPFYRLFDFFMEIISYQRNHYAMWSHFNSGLYDWFSKKNSTLYGRCPRNWTTIKSSS